MIRFVVLAAALGLLLLLRQFSPLAGSAGAIEPMTLAAVGFVVLAAFTVGELGGGLKLPRITGYILCGVVLGPQVSDLLSSGVVRDMKVFNTLALGLIALTAGLELDLAAIGRVLKTLLATLMAKLPTLVIFVGGAFLGLETAFGFLGVESEQARIAIALILSVLGIGTSPAIVLAVSNESGAKGRLTDLALALAVVKDLVVVVSLAIAIAIARTLIAPEAALGLDVLVDVAKEMGGSLLAGSVIGGVFILYLTYVHREMLLVILVVVLVGVEVARALHLELLLMFITAGFVVKNFSRHAETLHHPLERVALPVFVVFFTTAGATVDLQASLNLLPLALALVIARMLAFFLSARFGAWVGGEGPEVRSKAWLTYWPQAGITLGLVTLAAEKLPQIGSTIEEIGFAVVALNLLIGPVSIGLGLRWAGETKDAVDATPDPTTREPDPEAAERPTIEPILPLPREVPDPRGTLRSKLETEPLIGTVDSLASDLEDLLERFLSRRVQPLATEAREVAERMLGQAADAKAVVVGVSKTLADATPPLTEDWEALTEQLRSDLVERVLELPMRVTVPLSEGLLVPRSADGLATRIGRWRLRTLRSLSHSAARTRVVPMQVIARHRLEPRIAAGVRALASSSFEHYARVLDEVRAVVAGIHSPAEARAGVATLSERWLEATRREARSHLRTGIAEVADLASEAGAPGAEATYLRLSSVRSRLVADIEGLRRDTRRWHRVARAGIDTLRAEAIVEEAEERLDVAMKQRVEDPIGLLRDKIVPAVEQIAKRLDVIREAVEAEDAEGLDLDGVLSKTNNAFPRAEQKRMLRPRYRFRKLTQHSKLPAELERLKPKLPERLDLLPTGALVDAHEHPERVTVGQVAFAERMEAIFAAFVGQIREAMLRSENLVAFFDGRVADAVHLATYGVEAAQTYEADPEARRATATRALVRARDGLLALATEMKEAGEAAEEATEAADERARAALRALVREPRPRTVARVQGTLQAQRAALRSAVLNTFLDVQAFLRSVRVGLARRVRKTQQAAQSPRDAGGLRRALEAVAPPPGRLQLPPIYTKVFDLGPLEDARLAVARPTALQRVSSLLLEQTAGRVLIEGAPGSGRTSFLNMIELRARARRVVRIDATFHPRDEGLVGALATELGCPDYPLAVTQALLGEPTLVVVDDLGHHVMPNPAGVRELEALLRIVVDTSRQVSWAVSAEARELSVLAELVPVFGVFTERQVLEPIGARELERVVLARMNLAGLEVRFPRSSVIGSLGRRAARERRRRRAYFERLAREAAGNLREALVLHLRSLRTEGDAGLFARSPVAEPAPSLAGLSPRTVACLAMVAKFGPLLEEELSEVLLVHREVIRQHTLALAHSGLLEPDDRRLLRIPIHVQQPILRGLIALGLVDAEVAG